MERVGKAGGGQERGARALALDERVGSEGRAVDHGPQGVEPDGLVLGHKLFDTGEATLCTTVEQRVRLAAPLDPEWRRRIDERRVAWDGPARERRPRPSNPRGLRDSAHDRVKSAEIDVTGEAALSHYIHRFSAANGHAIAGGCVLACAADRRLMGRDAGRIGVTELLVGVPFPTVAFEMTIGISLSAFSFARKVLWR